MSTVLGSRVCGALGCQRAVAVHANGRCVHGRCPAHEIEALSTAFGPQPEAPSRRSLALAVTSGWASRPRYSLTG